MTTTLVTNTYDGAAPSDANLPGTWNRYVYAAGDPINNVDPTGNNPCSIETLDLDNTDPAVGCGASRNPVGYLDGCSPYEMAYGAGSNCIFGGGVMLQVQANQNHKTAPACVEDVQIFTRSITQPVGRTLGASHSYLEITTPDGLLLDTVEGQNQPQHSGPNLLVGVVDPGGTGSQANDPGRDDTFGGQLIVSCAKAALIIDKAQYFKPVRYAWYAGIFGPDSPAGAKSNTFLHWLIKHSGLAFYYPLPPPGAFGWYNTIPNNP